MARRLYACAGMRLACFNKPFFDEGHDDVGVVAFPVSVVVWSNGTVNSSSFPTGQDAKYVDTGVTDAITKHDAYVASKTFTPSNITKWVSSVEHAWAGWRNTVTDPEHMAAVELVRNPFF